MRPTPSSFHPAVREWAWVIIASVLIMALTTLPYAIGFARSGPEWHFSGFVFGVNDGNSYLGKMALGARGEWLFRLFYTTEEHPPTLLFTFHLLLGKLAALIAPPSDALDLHDRLVIGYHGARVACGFGLLLVSYRFCAEFLHLRSQRRLAFVLIALGGGLGWLLALLRTPALPLDFYSPEAFTFLNLYGLPHLAAARLLLLAGMIAYLKALTCSRPAGEGEGGMRAGLLFFLLGLIQPLYLIVVYAVLAAHVVALWLFRLPARRAIIAAIIAGLISSPPVLYTAFVFRADPILTQWQRQNLILSPSPLQYLAGWGLWLIPAAFAVRRFGRGQWRRPSRRTPARAKNAFLLAWTAVVPILLYFPYNLQRRFAEGAQLPIVILAIVGLTVGLAPWLGKCARRWAAFGVVALSLPTTAVLLVGGIIAASKPAAPIYLPADEIAAFRWLGENTAPASRVAVLATFDVGNALPAYAPVIVYLGHGPETAFNRRKQAEVESFFGREAGDDFRRSLLANNGIDFVIFDSPPEDAQRFDPRQAGYLRLEFSRGAYSVYRVVR